MAVTIGHRWIDAYEAVKHHGLSSIAEGHQVYILNAAASMLWKEYNWVCYIRKFKPFWLVPGVSKYGSPYYALPGELHALKTAEIWDGDTNEKLVDLTFLRDRRNESSIDWLPSVITVEYSAYTPVEFRLYPGVSDNIESSTYMVRGTYKRFHDRLDNDTISTAIIPYSHVMFSLVCKAVEYQILNKIGSPRAGQVSYVKNEPSYTGVLGEYKALVREFIEDESNRLGQSTVVPEEPFYANY